MILGNYSYINSLCGHNHSGITNPCWIINPHSMRGYYSRQNIDSASTLKLDSFPTGTSSPYAYIMGHSLGLISATTTLFQSNNITIANLAGGLNGETSISGSGDLIGELGALAFLISTIEGVGALTGDIQGTVLIAATLAGDGDLSGALGALVSILADLNGDGDLSGSIAGAVSAVAALSGDGDLVGSITALVQILSDLTGSGDLTAAIIGNWDMSVAIAGSSTLAADIIAYATILSDLIGSGTISLTSGAVTGNLSVVLSACGELVTPDSVASAVWEALAVSYNNPGTMGEIMNNVGAGADPWATTLPGTYTGDQAGAMVDRLESLIKQVKALAAANL